MDRSPGAKEYLEIMKGIAPQFKGTGEADMWEVFFKGIIDLLNNLNRRIEKLEKAQPEAPWQPSGNAPEQGKDAE